MSQQDTEAPGLSKVSGALTSRLTSQHLVSVLSQTKFRTSRDETQDTCLWDWTSGFGFGLLLGLGLKFKFIT